MNKYLEALLPPKTEELSAGWQKCAYQWYSMDYKERGDVCQAIADFWKLPFLKRLFYLPRAMLLVRYLKKTPVQR